MSIFDNFINVELPRRSLEETLDEMSKDWNPRYETHNGKAISLTDAELRHKLAGTRVIMSVCETCDKLLQDYEECDHGPPGRTR